MLIWRIPILSSNQCWCQVLVGSWILSYSLSLLFLLLFSLDGFASPHYDLCAPIFQDDLVGKSECCSPFPSCPSSLYIIVYTDSLYTYESESSREDFEKPRLRLRWDRLSGWLGNNTDCDYVLTSPVLRRRFQRILTTTLLPSSSASSTMNHPPPLQPGPRPIGPRSMDRSAPPVSTLQLPPTAPLNIRKASQPQQTNGNSIQTSSSNSSASFLSPHPPTNRGQPAPSLSLKIPTPGQPKAGKPKLKISYSFPDGDTDDSLSIDGAFSGGYYGGAAFQPTSLSAEGPEEATIRPNSADTQTVDDLRTTLRGLDINPTPPPKLSTLSSTSIHQVLSNSRQGDEWSDEFLQELDRLGEGAGGAVHKVRDKRTDVVMARKTITTREAPMKQLDRELSFMSSTSHTNIIKFYAAYISPSSSEIKLLMEFGEGGSLEAVGKRIREKGWRVGEKVAGRLAEGVSSGF